MTDVYSGPATAPETTTTERHRLVDGMVAHHVSAIPRAPQQSRRAERRKRAAAPPHRSSRIRLSVGTAVGAACLLVAHLLEPDNTSLFAWPVTPSGWAALLLGLTGIWLVPGLWLSALMVTTGAGRTAWWGTRIATTLLWYAAVGPVIHHLGEGAQVTTRGIVIVTVTSAAAATLGTVLGLIRRPVSVWCRALLAAAIGAVAAQSVIWLTMRLWTYDMNYAHIRRLDWLIVLACAVLVAVAASNHPKTPPRLTAGGIGTILFAIGVLAATVAALVVTNINWSPAQRMPSSFGIEQVDAPGGDVAFLLTAIGPGGPAIIEQADFTATDEFGRALPISTEVRGADGASDRATLLVTLLPEGRALLCRAEQPAKISVRDSVSGVRVQAPVPEGWCGR